MNDWQALLGLQIRTSAGDVCLMRCVCCHRAMKHTVLMYSRGTYHYSIACSLTAQALTIRMQAGGSALCSASFALAFALLRTFGKCGGLLNTVCIGSCTHTVSALDGGLTCGCVDRTELKSKSKSNNADTGLTRCICSSCVKGQPGCFLEAL